LLFPLGIPRYRLLLESLLKFTPPAHQDFKLLTNAIELVSAKANEINQKMALASQQKRVMEISSMFESLPLAEVRQLSALYCQQVLTYSQDLVQPYRYLVGEYPFDWLSLFQVEGKQLSASNVSTTALTMYLFNDLVIFAEKSDHDSKLKLHCIGVHPIYSSFLKKLDDTWELAGTTELSIFTSTF